MCVLRWEHDCRSVLNVYIFRIKYVKRDLHTVIYCFMREYNYEVIAKLAYGITARVPSVT